MNLTLVSTAIVVAGQNYAPSVLNPDFLKAAKITKKSWDLAQPPITTPIFSIVKYTNRISFLVESNKLQVLYEYPPNGSVNTQFPDIASKFIQSMGHIRHVGIGINVTALVEYPTYETFITENLIAPGVWKSKDLTTSLVRFIYSLSNVSLHLTLDKGTAKFLEESTERAGILVHANYHVEIPADLSLEESSKEVSAAISRFQEHQNHFRGIVTKFFDLED